MMMKLPTHHRDKATPDIYASQQRNGKIREAQTEKTERRNRQNHNTEKSTSLSQQLKEYSDKKNQQEYRTSQCHSRTDSNQHF